MSPQLLRRIVLLTLIPRAPRKIGIAALQYALDERGLPIGRRSLQNDLTELAAVLPIVSDEQTKPYGWSWRQDADAFLLPLIAPESALALAFMKNQIDVVMPHPVRAHLTPVFSGANAALATAAIRYKRWLGKVRLLPRGQPLVKPKVNALALDVVFAALLDEKQCRVAYRKQAADGASASVINPLGIVLRDNVGFLVASYASTNDLRTFLFHGVESAEALDRPCEVPRGFDLDKFIASGELGWRVTRDQIRLVFLVEPRVGARLLETPLTAAQRVTKQDGWLRIEAELADTQELRGYLRGYGEHLEILEPLSLRAEFAKSAERMAARYRHDVRSASFAPVE